MSLHPNCFESDDRALEQNCLFVRNRCDNHQVFEGSGASNISALPHNYTATTPMSGTNRSVSPQPPSPPRMVNWSQYRNESREYQKKMGNNFDSRRRKGSVTPPPPSPPHIDNFSQYLNGLDQHDANQRKIGNNLSSRRHNRSVTPTPPSPPHIGHTFQYRNERNEFRNHKGARSRSPADYKNRKSSRSSIKDFSHYRNERDEYRSHKRERSRSPENYKNRRDSREHDKQRNNKRERSRSPENYKNRRDSRERDNYKNHKRERSRSPINYKNRRNSQQQEPNLLSNKDFSHYRNERDEYRNHEKARSRSSEYYKNRIVSGERDRYGIHKRERSRSPVSFQNRRNCQQQEPNLSPYRKESDEYRIHKRTRSRSPITYLDWKNSQEQDPNLSSIERDYLDQNIRMKNTSNHRLEIEHFNYSRNTSLPYFDHFMKQGQPPNETQFLQDRQYFGSRGFDSLSRPFNSIYTQSMFQRNIPDFDNYLHAYKERFFPTERILSRYSEQYILGPPNRLFQRASFFKGPNARARYQGSPNLKKTKPHVLQSDETQPSSKSQDPKHEDLQQKSIDKAKTSHLQTLKDIKISKKETETSNEQITKLAAVADVVLEKDSPQDSQHTVAQTTQMQKNHSKIPKVTNLFKEENEASNEQITKPASTSAEILEDTNLSMEDNETSNEIITKPASTTASVFEGGSPPNSQSAVSQTTQNLRGPKRRKKNKTKLIQEKQTSHSEVFKRANLRREGNQKTIEQITERASTSAAILGKGSLQSSQSAVTQTTQTFPGPTLKKKKAIVIKQISNEEIIKSAPLTAAVLKTGSQFAALLPGFSGIKKNKVPIDIKPFPKREIIMPTAKNWSDWFKSNSWVEEKITKVSETDSEIIKTFFKHNNVNDLKISLAICLETITNLLTSARLTGKYRDPYNFLKCIVMLHGIIPMSGINKLDRRVCSNLLKQIHILDMIKYYKLIICMWKKSYGTTPSGEIRPTEPLPQSVNEKAFNWLVLLAFKELKRISNPILNPPHRLEQLRQLYEFTGQVPPREKEKIFSFIANKLTAEEFVRSTIDRQTIYLEKEGEITRESYKELTIARMHLMEEALTEQLSVELRKEKDDFLAKLKVNSFARQNYDLLIHDMLTAYAKYLDLQRTDPRLKHLFEKEIPKISWIHKCDFKIATKFLLDERLSEYGSYLNEEKIAIENTRNLSFDVNGEHVQPIPVPKAKEDQYKDLHEFASGYDPEEIQNVFFYESPKGATEDLIRNVRFLINYLQDCPNFLCIRTESCKNFVIRKIRLADKTVDEIISEHLKKEKYALLEKLKKDPFAQENYNYLLENALNLRMRYLHLSTMDQKLLKDSEEMEILKFENLSKNHSMKFIWKHLLDERLAETGSYCNAYFVAQENLEETSDVESSEEEQNNSKHCDKDENIANEKVEDEQESDEENKNIEGSQCNDKGLRCLQNTEEANNREQIETQKVGAENCDVGAKAEQIAEGTKDELYNILFGSV